MRLSISSRDSTLQGRTLTREDITFERLKVGWKTGHTQNRSAKQCVEDLSTKLKSIQVDDVVSAITFVWSVSFNSGKLLNNVDLMRGGAITPMAVNVSENWRLVEEAAEHAGITPSFGSGTEWMRTDGKARSRR